ncbi:hypothetical protein DW182_06145 [Bacteroides sp. AM16-24]|uniref:hypothetical protein n=1 Tax=Bacteroides sp. AM16-24 TaxID=2292002 RepID=UPI000E469AB3|nr:MULTISPECIES: hypothetical protein [Bacteroides]RHI10778.1 hypothetical protein DW182_06145 [Bacteroides sp. AM16-24]
MEGGKGEIIIYQTPNGQTEIDVRMEKETVWLTLNQMALLFDRDKSVISRHIKIIFNEDDLDRNSVVAKRATTGRFAESRTEEKDIMVKVVVNLINRNN